MATYNDLANVEELIKNEDVAAVILEPVVGNSGFIRPTPEFLKGCRELCTKYGTLLVFDEVMTGFRIAYGGAQVRTRVCVYDGISLSHVDARDLGRAVRYGCCCFGGVYLVSCC